MQHDLKWHEERMAEPALVGWCICGRWQYKSPLLNQIPMVDEFLEHLQSVSESD